MAFTPKKRKTLETAQKYAQKGAHDKALKEYQKLLKADPQDSNIRLKIGDLYLKKGEKAAAIESYGQVAEQFSKGGFDAKAVAIYKQILRVDGESLDARTRLGEHFQRMGLTGDALREFQEAVTLCQQREMKREALDLLKKVASLDPTNVPNRLNLAELFRRENLAEEARAEYDSLLDEMQRQTATDLIARVAQHALGAFPNHRRALDMLAQAKIRMREPREAIRLLIEAQPRFPEDLGLLETMVMAYESAGDEDGKQRSYREMAELYKRRGDNDKAREIMQRFVVAESFAPDDEYTSPSIILTEETMGNLSLDLDEPAFGSDRDLTDPTAPSLKSPRFAEHVPTITRNDTADDLTSRSDLIAEAKVALEFGDPEAAARLARQAAEIDPHSSELLELFALLEETNTPGIDSLAKQLEAAGVSMQMPQRRAGTKPPTARTAAPAPARPAAKSAPARPAAKSAPARPVAKSAPARPVAKSAPARPEAKSAPARPAAKSAPARPEAKSAPARPAAKSAPAPAAPAARSAPAGRSEPGAGETRPQTARPTPRPAPAPVSRPAAAPVAAAPEPDLDDALDALPDVEIVLADSSDDDPTYASVDPPEGLDLFAAEDSTGELDIGIEIDVELDSDLAEFEIDEVVHEVTPSESEHHGSALFGQEEQWGDDSTQIGDKLARADALLGEDRLDDARRLYREVLAQIPNHPQAMLRLGEIEGRRQAHSAPAAAKPAARPATPATAHRAGPSEFELELDDVPGPPSIPELTLPPERSTFAQDTLPPLERSLEDAPLLENSGAYDACALCLDLDLDSEPELEIGLAHVADPEPEFELEAEPEPEPEFELEPEPEPEFESPFGDGESFDLAAELEAGLGESSIGEGQIGIDQVFSAFKKGIQEQVGEDEIDAHYDLAIAYKEMGLLDDSIRELELVLRSGTRNIESLSLLATCRLELGQAAEAEAHLLQALGGVDDGDPTAVSLRYDLAEALLAGNKQAEALEMFRSVAAADPEFRDVGERIAELE